MMRVHPTLQMFSRFNSHQLKKPYRECVLYNASFSRMPGEVQMEAEAETFAFQAKIAQLMSLINTF
ncbi:hypothetical protein DAPPUDRAFT_245299 [Daphnia pulex]|uniref:Uncharacterized protein n=1 Tax=Daphnia pulex TaxID=6669 RepID=E9GN13_DAPPU|nr:hypothetical protein DAPPUDRAFT_245299 [Daphnia pulex]|eukprot:EFX79191.1 hypothetical protein DAPPUDRAFT_245299 [Daphnia pulex]